MHQRFLDFIKNNRLFEPDDTILLAVSGGVDSMVMEHLFYSNSLQYAVAHCNFGLRGSQSDADEALVCHIAGEHGVKYFCERFQTEEFANQNGISIQMAARELRYDWFRRICKEHGYRYIATAHQQDDQIETIMINIVRGTGLRGLKGIPVKIENIVRPLAFASRNEIQSFAHTYQIPYREDASNADDKYMRNKIRHHVVPVLKQINPSLGSGIEQISRVATQSSQLLEFFIQKEFQKYIFSTKDKTIIRIEGIKNYPAWELIVYELLRPFDFQPDVSNDIARALFKQPGKLFYSPTHVCCKDRDALIIEPLHNNDINQSFYIEEKQQLLELLSGRLELWREALTKKPEFSNNQNIALFDLDKVSFPLQVRHPVPGDYFYPLGMQGRKKINDFLTDQKIPLTEKEKIWLLISEECIVWVVGHRVDDRFKISNKTRNVLGVKFVSQKND